MCCKALVSASVNEDSSKEVGKSQLRNTRKGLEGPFPRQDLLAQTYQGGGKRQGCAGK